MVLPKHPVRVTMDDIENEIVNEHYFTAGKALESMYKVDFPQRMHMVTICVLELQSGFIVTGESACICPEIFSDTIGMKLARENATNKVWAYLGFRLSDELYAQKCEEKAEAMVMIDDSEERIQFNEPKA